LHYRNNYLPIPISCAILNTKFDILASDCNDWDRSHTRFQNKVTLSEGIMPAGEYIFVMIPLANGQSIPGSNKVNVTIFSPGSFKCEPLPSEFGYQCLERVALNDAKSGK